MIADDRISAALDALGRVRAVANARHVPGALAISGSVAMMLHGVDLGRAADDIDVAVSPALWHAVAGTPGWWVERPDQVHPPIAAGLVADVRVHAFGAWRRDEWWVDHTALLERSVFRSGWPVVRVEDLLVVKCAAIGWVTAARGTVDGAPQAKHVEDARRMGAFLGRTA